MKSLEALLLLKMYFYYYIVVNNNAIRSISEPYTFLDTAVVLLLCTLEIMGPLVYSLKYNTLSFLHSGYI